MNIDIKGIPPEPIVDIKFSCVYFILLNKDETHILDECPYKKVGYPKPCIRKGNPCKNLQAELVEVLKIR